MHLGNTPKDDYTDELTDLENIDSESECTDENVFLKYNISAEKAISLDNTFILSMSSKYSGNTLKVATGLSNNCCELFDVSNESIKNISSIKNAHSQVVTQVNIIPETHLCYTSSLDGFVKVWDLRSIEKPVMELKDDSDSSDAASVKPVTCFDVSNNNILLCGGTEEVDGDSFLLFWDLRTGTLHGGYWESHTDDITQVQFHPTSTSTLMSGSTDGLINIFDINEPNEDDALQNCLNTEDSVEKLCWLNESTLSCITLTAQVQMWNVDETCPSVLYRRKQIANSAQMKSSASCYMINTHTYKNKTILLTGSNYGKADCLRSLELFDSIDKPILTHAQFIGNKQIIRCSAAHEENDLFLTGGEAGIISIWKSSLESESGSSSSKVKSSLKSNEKRKSKPYSS